MRAFFVLALLACASAAPAQIRFGEMGFELQSPSGGTAGDACWGFDCNPRPLRALAGEQLTATIRAPLGAPFVVLFSTSATSCLPVPGIWHELVLDPPWFAFFVGNINRPNTMRFCYDGFAVRTLSLPPSLPSGFMFGLQAAATIGTPIQPQTGWATSSAVLTTVR